MRVLDFLSDKLDRLKRLEEECQDLHMPIPPKAVITATLFSPCGTPQLQIRDLAQTWNYNYYKFAGWAFLPPEDDKYHSNTGGFEAGTLTALAQDGITHRNLTQLMGSAPIPNTTNLRQGIIIGNGERMENSVRLMSMPQIHQTPEDFIVTIQSTENAALRWDDETQTWYKKLWKSYQNIREDEEDIIVTEVGLSKGLGNIGMFLTSPSFLQGMFMPGGHHLTINDGNAIQTTFAWSAAQFQQMLDRHVLMITNRVNAVLGSNIPPPPTIPNPWGVPSEWGTLTSWSMQNIHTVLTRQTAHTIASLLTTVTDTGGLPGACALFIMDHTKLAERMAIQHNAILQVNYDITLKVG